MATGLPRQLARTKRFTIGAPRDFAVVAEGRYVTYLRDDELWVYDTETRAERRISAADSYVVDSAPLAAVLHESQLWLANLETGQVDQLPVTDASRPRPDPTGSMVAYVKDRALWVIDADGTNERVLLEPTVDEVSYGVPEFVAWMSFDRNRGFWWSPDGTHLLVARVDESPVRVLYTSDPADPASPPKPFRYPSVGTPNADITLHLVDLSGNRLEVTWDRKRLEYLVRVDWSTRNPLLAVQSRDQKTVQLLEVDPATGATTLVREVTDPEWVDVRSGVPTRTGSGEVVWIERDVEHDTDRLLIGETFVSPPGLQVCEVRTVDGDAVVFTGQTDPTETHVYLYDGEIRQLSKESGVHDGWCVQGTTLLDSSTFDGQRTTVDGQPIPSYEERPELELRVELIRAGERELRTAVFRPSWQPENGEKLPVLLNPYAGPAMQVAVATRHWHYLLSQWFAEQGFIVVTTDGRGTPGRGPAFQRAVYGDTVQVVLDDQIDALHAVAERYGDLDLARVAMRGWSFSGYLAAAAVLHRPETFHAAIAGAALSDQRMYDTYWKERFLGQFDSDPDAYRRASLLPYAAQLERPLLIVQGLADTNVLPMHALRFSAALTAAGRPHRVLAIPGQGHRITDEDLVANLPYIELDFLQQSLGLRSTSPAADTPGS